MCRTSRSLVSRLVRLIGYKRPFSNSNPGGGFARFKTSVSNRSWKWTVLTSFSQNKHISSRHSFTFDLPKSVSKPAFPNVCGLRFSLMSMLIRKERDEVSSATLYPTERRGRVRRFAGMVELCSCDQKKKKKICMQRRGKSDDGGWEFSSMHVALVAPEMGRIIGCHGNWLQTWLIKCGYNYRRITNLTVTVKIKCG